MKSLGIEYFFCKEPIMTMAEEHMQGDSYCAFCARMKRGTIYATARKHNYNVIALAQHLDDLAESFFDVCLSWWTAQNHESQLHD